MGAAAAELQELQWQRYEQRSVAAIKAAAVAAAVAAPAAAAAAAASAEFPTATTNSTGGRCYLRILELNAAGVHEHLQQPNNRRALDTCYCRTRELLLMLACLWRVCWTRNGVAGARIGVRLGFPYLISAERTWSAAQHYNPSDKIQIHRLVPRVYIMYVRVFLCCFMCACAVVVCGALG